VSQLSEVARTGREFWRTSEPHLIYFLSGKQVRGHKIVNNLRTKLADDIHFYAEQIIATDWVAQPKKIEVTEADLMAVARILSEHPITNQRRLAPVEFMKLVVEELGLNEL
jgi:hypothetical protein